MRGLALGLLLLTTTPAWGQSLSLDGAMTQGGLVIGRTSPGAEITLDGRSIEVSADGAFLLGFAWNAAAEARLRAHFADGRTAERRLRIARRQFRVQRIDGLPPRKVTPSAADLVRIRAEKKLITAARKNRSRSPMFLSGFIRPAAGPVSGVYGSRRILNGQPRRPHFGVDIAGPKGSPVHAMADGRVMFTHPGMFFNGKTILLDHGLGLSSIYIHLDGVVVKTGDRVKKGSLIGRIGESGRATGPHLHWAVRLNGIEVDPALVVTPAPK